MKRPAPPHLRAGRPGVHAETTRPEVTTPSAAPAATAPSATATLAATPDRPRRRTAARRTLLIAGALATAAVPVTAGALLRGGGSAGPSATSSTASPSAASPARAAEAKTVPAGPFTDIAADAAGAEAMAWADETGVQPALTPTTYAPQEPVTRGDVALALHRFAGSPAVLVADAALLITDLGEDPARRAALLWMHGRGALWGDAELRVHPEAPATRDCAAMMLAALLRPALSGVGVTWDDSQGSVPTPTSAPGSALPDVAWLVASGMVPPTITLDGWAGEAGVTRAELAVSLHCTDTAIADALA